METIINRAHDKDKLIYYAHILVDILEQTSSRIDRDKSIEIVREFAGDFLAISECLFMW